MKYKIVSVREEEMRSYSVEITVTSKERVLSPREGEVTLEDVVDSYMSDIISTLPRGDTVKVVAKDEKGKTLTLEDTA